MDRIFQIESQEEFQKALREVICNFHNSNYPTQIPNCIVNKSAKDDFKNLLMGSNFDTNKIAELIVDKRWDEEKVEFFINLINEKKTELLYSLLVSQNSEYGEVVTNFEWLLKLVMGTSEINTLKYPLLQLILSTNCNGINKKMLYEINKDMLLKTIDTLEKLDETIS